MAKGSEVIKTLLEKELYVFIFQHSVISDVTILKFESKIFDSLEMH